MQARNGSIPLLAASVALALVGSLPAAERLRVVATVPNLGAIAHEIGGDRAEVTTIASGLQDAHFVEPKPSFIVRLRSADLLLVNGLDLEVGWVPPLTQGARNAKILPGGPGYIDCSRHVEVLEIPTGAVSRAEGDVHPFGNPHYLADPLNGEVVAYGIAEAFKAAAPADAAYFEGRRADFVHRLHVALFGSELVDLAGGPKLSRLTREGSLDAFLSGSMVDGKPLASRLGGWLGRLRPWSGTRLVTYHRDYTYFERRFGLRIVDFVEPKPGIQPSLKHIEELTQRIGRGDVKLLITRPYVEHRSTTQLAERTAVPQLTLPLEVGGAPEASDFISLFEHVVSSIAETLGHPQAGR